MTIEQLENCILVIKKLRASEDKLKVAFDTLNDNHNYGMLGTFETEYVALLKIAANDEYDWISYFIYDCEFGSHPLKVTPNNGKEIKLKTVKQLHKLIYG